MNHVSAAEAEAIGHLPNWQNLPSTSNSIQEAKLRPDIVLSPPKVVGVKARRRAF
jgi:hypothetical protein